MPQLADALPGRIDYLDLWPLAQTEIADATSPFIDRAFAGDVEAVTNVAIGPEAYADLIARGGFPEAIRRSERSRVSFFGSYVTSMIRLDVPGLGAVGETDDLRRLLRVLSGRSAQLVNWSGFGSALGLSDKTVKRYVEILETLFVVDRSRPWFANVNQREVKREKVYVTDTGLLASTLGLNAVRMTSDPALLGAIVETFVANEIRRLAGWAETPLAGIFHYRDQDRREVDIILEALDGSIVGIEVKAGATVRAADLRHLAWLRDARPDIFRQGILLHTGDRTRSWGDRLTSMPISALWT